MEQLPLTFTQSVLDPEIQECFTPAYNFTKLNSSNGRLAFTTGKVYWLPDSPMALMDQGWVINVSEIDSCSKYGISGFTIKLVDGKELRFSNVGQKMRDEIAAAIEAHRGDVVAEAPAAEAPAAAAEAPAAEAGPAAAPAIDPSDISANKVMAILAYIGILVLIPLFAAKESKFARFHTNQGLILFICNIVIYFISLIPGLKAIGWILSVAALVFAIIGIIGAAKGETKELPLIGKYRIIA
ncbi:MAG: hypothetical protein IJP93_08950 [Bacteroidales bacterium]|nr:hypothetical protein [Bacteroidales bacterium]MBR0084198.1 hypothetical protein [Bacteroidales bacterium]